MVSGSRTLLFEILWPLHEYLTRNSLHVSVYVHMRSPMHHSLVIVQFLAFAVVENLLLYAVTGCEYNKTLHWETNITGLLHLSMHIQQASIKNMHSNECMESPFFCVICPQAVLLRCFKISGAFTVSSGNTLPRRVTTYADIKAAFISNGIPYQIVAGKGLLKKQSVKELLAYCRWGKGSGLKNLFVCVWSLSTVVTQEEKLWFKTSCFVLIAWLHSTVQKSSREFLSVTVRGVMRLNGEDVYCKAPRWLH